MITDTIKTYAFLATIAALTIALGISRWELSEANKELLDIKVAVEVQNTKAIEQQATFKENLNDLNKTIANRDKLIAANRLLRSSNKASTSRTPDSTECTYAAATPSDSETVEFGFRDQAVDVANQLELLKLFVTDNKLPVGL